MDIPHLPACSDITSPQAICQKGLRASAAYEAADIPALTLHCPERYVHAHMNAVMSLISHEVFIFGGALKQCSGLITVEMCLHAGGRS